MHYYQQYRNHVHYYQPSNHVNKMAPRATNKKSAAPKKIAALKAAAQGSSDYVDLSNLPDTDSPAQSSAGGESGPPRPGAHRIRPEDMTNEERIAFGLAPSPDGQGHPDADHSPEPTRIRKVKPESPCKRSKIGSPPRSPGRTPPNPNLDELMTGDDSPTVPFEQPEEFMATSRFPFDWAAIVADAGSAGERFLATGRTDGQGDTNTVMEDDPAPVTPAPQDNAMKDDDPAPLTPAPQDPSRPDRPCPKALPHEDECGCKSCIVSSIQVMFASTSKQLISEVKVGFDETLNIQNARTQSLDEKFTDQINSAFDLLSEKHNVQVEQMMTDVADIKKATDVARAADIKKATDVDDIRKAVSDIKKATDDVKAAALAAQPPAKQAVEKVTDMKDDMKNGSSRALSEASTEAGGTFSYSYLGAAKAQESKAPAPRAATALPPRVADSIVPKSPENDGYTLVAGGFDRDTAADTMQEWLTNNFMKQIPDAIGAKPVYKKGSTAHVKFKTRDAVWHFLKERSEHLGPAGAKLWFSFPKSREERIYGSTLSTFKRTLVALLPADTQVTIRWDEGLFKVSEIVVARVSPSDNAKTEISEKQLRTAKTKLTTATINSKLAEIRANTDAAVRDVTDWS